MNSKERVKKSLNYEKQDRLPIGEIEINSKQASEVLKRETFVGIGGNYFVKKGRNVDFRRNRKFRNKYRDRFS